ncbi:glycosyltransferase [Streptomyces pathocidini]|uniref:glycosyltransferase family 2 protein n=1 Tax=Streptomyces pathocidini TaxID=1650571 RepID=UPI0034076AB2
MAVVIPYGGGLDDLREQLTALSQQTWPHPYEVVISVNRGQPTPVHNLARHILPDHVTLTIADSTSRPGPSHARNVGWRHTTADLILFCDTDDVVHPAWLTAMTHTLTEARIASGALEYRKLNPPWKADLFGTGAYSQPVRFHHLPFGPSCNLGLHRELLERLDGFSEDLPCAEDTDLCWRAAYAGAPIAFAPSAVVHYRLRSTSRALFGQYVRYTRYDVHLYRAHRSHGARVHGAEILRELAVAGKALLNAPRGRRHRARCAISWGTVLGGLLGLLTQGPRARKRPAPSPTASPTGPV